MALMLHDRALLVQSARNELSRCVVKVWEQHELTAIELVTVLATLTAEYAKYPLRDERHPGQPDKKANEE